VVSVLFALLTALFNGLASVLQRMAAVDAPASKALHLSLFGYLIRRKVWLAGIGMVVLAAVCQAIALATGPVALVQPIFIIELPFTLLVASRLAHRKLPRMTWWAVGLVTVALGIGLAAAAPSGGGTDASARIWAAALIVTGIFQAVVITVGVKARGNVRAAAFGLAAACGYALTATLLKSAVAALDHGIGPFFSTWQLYATAVAGVGALFLLQNALQAGSLVYVQPPLTLGDALISSFYGVFVFGEDVRTGGWLLAVEIVAVIAVAIGCIELSRSLAMVQVAQPTKLPGEPAADEPVGRDLSWLADVDRFTRDSHQLVEERGDVHRDPDAAVRDGRQRHVGVAVDRERGADEEHRVVHLAQRDGDPTGQEHDSPVVASRRDGICAAAVGAVVVVAAGRHVADQLDLAVVVEDQDLARQADLDPVGSAARHEHLGSPGVGQRPLHRGGHVVVRGQALHSLERPYGLEGVGAEPAVDRARVVLQRGQPPLQRLDRSPAHAWLQGAGRRGGRRPGRGRRRGGRGRGGHGHRYDRHKQQGHPQASHRRPPHAFGDILLRPANR
jgi:drug/metabolite transporter (DMT)-like permease